MRGGWVEAGGVSSFHTDFFLFCDLCPFHPLVVGAEQLDVRVVSPYMG